MNHASNFLTVKDTYINAKNEKFRLQEVTARNAFGRP
jgi:hypothetical protein